MVVASTRHLYQFFNPQKFLTINETSPLRNEKQVLQLCFPEFRCGKVFNGNFYHRFKLHVEGHEMPHKLLVCNDCGFESRYQGTLTEGEGSVQLTSSLS